MEKVFSISTSVCDIIAADFCKSVGDKQVEAEISIFKSAAVRN